MNVDRVFIETLDDLEGRAVWGASEYELLRAGALLRELLLDESPLLLAANRTRHHRLAFNLREPPSDAGLIGWLGIDPAEPAVGGPIREMNVKELLAFPMFLLGASDLTVRDLILLGANVLGGVHLGRPRTRPQQAREAFPLKIKHGSTPLELVALVPISAVVLRGLEPLRREVASGLPPLVDLGGRVAVRWTGRP